MFTDNFKFECAIYSNFNYWNKIYYFSWETAYKLELVRDYFFMIIFYLNWGDLVLMKVERGSIEIKLNFWLFPLRSFIV